MGKITHSHFFTLRDIYFHIEREKFTTKGGKDLFYPHVEETFSNEANNELIFFKIWSDYLSIRNQSFYNKMSKKSK